MTCSTFCGLDEPVGAGEKKCTRAPNTQPTIWTASAPKTKPSQPPWPDLQGSLCSGSFLSCLFAQAFPAEIFSQLTPGWCLPHSRCSINISSLFFHTSFNMRPHPCYSILPMLLSWPCLPIMFGQSKSPSFKTPAQKTEVGRWKEAQTRVQWFRFQPLLSDSGQVTSHLWVG